MGLTWSGGGGAYRGAGELDHGPGDGDGDHDASRAPASYSWILETLELYSSLMIPKEGREQCGWGQLDFIFFGETKQWWEFLGSRVVE